MQRSRRALQAEGTVSAKALGLERRRIVGTKPKKQATAKSHRALQVTVKLLDFILKNTDVKERF